MKPSTDAPDTEVSLTFGETWKVTDPSGLVTLIRPVRGAQARDQFIAGLINKHFTGHKFTLILRNAPDEVED